VGYYSSHADKTNVFQMLLEDLGTAGVRVVFNYDRVQWETGDADGGDNGLGGTSAAAGFTTGEGDPLHALLLGGSFAPGAFLDGGPQSLAAGSNVGVPGRYVFTIDTVGSPGSRIAGVVKSTGGTPEGGAAVQACLASDPTNCVTRFADSTGAYRIRGLTTPGSYVLTAFSTGTEQPGTRTVSGVTGATGDNHTGQDITLGEPLHAPPDGTTVTNIGTQDGVPVLSWTQPITITTQGCTGGTGTYTVRVQGTVVSSGALTESPAGSGTFTATAPPTAPKHGNTEITTHITCPAGPPRDTDFGVYIDPSGVVIDQTGAPVSGAQVVLRRAGNADGPFFDVPDGSVVMSPSNRSNPVTTDATGVFHWDVVAGYYVVRATKDGCVSAADHSNPVASTPVMHVPPPATGLQLQLYCGPLTPAAPPASPPGSPAPAPTPPVVVTGAPPARALLVLGTAKLRKGRLAVQIRCASAAVGACAGSLTASVKRTTLGHRTFSRLKPGKSTTITLKLSRKARKALHAAAKKHRAKLTVSVTVHDAKGAGAVARRTLSVKA
jgi:hypothetical protein